MSVWAGYVGPSSACQAQDLQRLLGQATELCTGAGFGLGIQHTGAAPVTLITAADGRITAAIGSDAEAGSSAAVYPLGPTLMLRRDPFGLYGLYTTQIGQVTWFASDPHVLQRLPDVATQLDPVALHGYLCLSYVPTPLTLTPGVTALPAGARLVLQPGAHRPCDTQAAWSETAPLALSEDQIVTALRHRLRAAVARRVGAAREVGVFLSGGIDSSFIAALLVDLGVRVHLFTLDFGPPFDLEVPYAQHVASHLSQPWHRVPASPVHVKTALQATAAALAQPFGDGVTVPLYLLGQAAAQWVDVVFNGEGGDQLFGGWATKPMIAAELYGTAHYDRKMAYLRTYHRFYGLTERFYTPRARAAVDQVDVGAWVRPALNAAGFSSLLHRLRAANLWLKGAQNIAPRATQLAAAHGLRVHTPFFDQALTEWTFALPPVWFLHGACEKYLLKRAAEPYLPAAIVWHDKRGMGVPTTQWCLGPLQRDVARWLSSRRLQQAGWLAPKAVAALRRGIDQPGEFRQRRAGEKLWALLMLHIWCETRERPLAWPTAAP